MPDDEFMTKEERAALFEEWEQDYALRREEDANRRLVPPFGGPAREPRPSAEILPFPASPRPWPSEIARGNSIAKPGRSPAEAKGNSRDDGHSQ